ncbi:AmmeMemoRadiSam system protein A [Persephonella sp.]
MDDVIKSPDQITEEEGKGLVSLSRTAVEEYLKSNIIIDLQEVPYENWKKKGASFVTIENRYTGSLRGCIGSIIPVRELYKDVIHNAVSAAVRDPRFNPLKLEELPEVKFKVSVLSFPEELHFKDPYDLVNKVEPFKDGLILKYEDYQGTFLPDVWKQIPDKQLFLSNLCAKAGMPPDCWLKYPIKVFRYRTKTFSE